ncbi:MAG: ABC transporter permease [Myxococcota bacterium]
MAGLADGLSAGGGLVWSEAQSSTPEARRWILGGSLDGTDPRHLEKLFSRPLPPAGGSLTLDLSQLEHLDTAGAAALVHLWRLGKRRDFGVKAEGASPTVLRFLEMVRVNEDPPEPERPPNVIEALGDTGYSAAGAFKDVAVLTADVTIQAILDLARPWRLRGSALIEQCILMGSRAVGIVALIAFLVGLTLAFQSAFLMRQFGAAVYVAGLTSASVVREMGPLITAIMVAGRSGSAITSEVATMQVNEEIDALHVMGIPFVSFVAVPRLLALVLTLPLLTIVADLAGIAGGWIVGAFWLEIAHETWLRGTLDALSPRDLLNGIIKSVTFAWGIGLIGLHYGRRVRGGAQEVGRATTASVVTSIFFIIVAAAAFSVLFYVVLP